MDIVVVTESRLINRRGFPFLNGYEKIISPYTAQKRKTDLESRTIFLDPECMLVVLDVTLSNSNVFKLVAVNAPSRPGEMLGDVSHHSNVR